MKWPALGLLEFKSVARGITSTDAMLKQAPVILLETHPICPGKYMTVICGEVADVEESLKAGIAKAGDLLVNDLFLPQIHKTVIPAISASNKIEKFKSIGILETFSVAACIVAADIAAKTAAIDLVEIRLANGLGGKAYIVMSGELSDVQASLDSAAAYVRKDGLLTACELIENPHPDLIAKGVYW